MKQLAWNEQEFKKSMHRINIQDTEIRGLLDQVLNFSLKLSTTLVGSSFNIETFVMGTPVYIPFLGDKFKNIIVWSLARFHR